MCFFAHVQSPTAHSPLSIFLPMTVSNLAVLDSTATATVVAFAAATRLRYVPILFNAFHAHHDAIHITQCERRQLTL